MGVAHRLAQGYLRSRSGRLFTRPLTHFATMSLALGVAAAILTQAAIRGFHDELEQKLLGLSADLTVRAPVDDEEGLQVWAEQQGVALYPVVEGEVVLQRVGEEGFADLGVMIRGIAPAMLREMTAAQFIVPDGATLGDALAVRKSISGIIAGSEVLSALAMHPELDADVLLRATAPLGGIGPSGQLQAIARNVQLRGFFHTGLFREDSKVVFMEHDAARRLLGLQARASWQIFLPASQQLDAVAASLRSALDDRAHIQTWREQHANLFSALQLEQTIMSIVLAVMLAVAGVSMFAVTYLHAMSRRRDFAVLAALGCSVEQVRNTVLVLGGYIGLRGAAIGVVIAAAVSAWLAQFPIILPASFYVQHLPVEFSLESSFWVVLGAYCVSLIASWYPAAALSRHAIAAQLRCE